MLQGVLARGTARSIAGMAPFVAGKTGTSDDENDAWFVGFSNDVTVAVWVGYDNAGGKRRTLGGGATGGHTAVPIFDPIMQAVWAQVAPKTALASPSPEAKRQLSCTTVSDKSTDGKRQGSRECLRVDARGKVLDTQYRLVSLEKKEKKKSVAAQEPRKAVKRAPTVVYRASNPYAYRASAPYANQSQWGWSQGWGGWGGYYR